MHTFPEGNGVAPLGELRERESLVTFEIVVEGASERSLALFLGKARQAVGLRGNVNVVVTTNRAMRELNRRFRRKDKPTDVLSFPATLDPKMASPSVGPSLGIAGDIAISAQMATENARKLGHVTGVELKVLVLHGVLHLAGYDHENDDGEMARKEGKLRRALGLPDGLIERAGASTKSGSLAPPGITHNSKPRTRSDKSVRSRR